MTTQFANRKDAALQLAERLSSFRKEHPLIIGIPRGGVEIAYYVARELQVGFTVAISKKIPHPANDELAIGALGEEGILFISDRNRFPEMALKPVLQKVGSEIDRRIERYRKGRPLPGFKGQTVIIVDDGIATGATLVPVVRLCRKHQAAQIVVAAPVSGGAYEPELSDADKLIVLIRPEPFYGVGQAYRSFDQMTDDEVLNFLKDTL